MGIAHRELDEDELGDAALGWELRAPRGVRAHYLLPREAPYCAPVVRIVSPDEARTSWDHVERDGTVCLRPPGESGMPSLHPAGIRCTLRALGRVIEVNANGSPQEPDPGAARHRWLTGGARAWSLVDPAAGGPAVAARVEERWVVAPDRQVLTDWLRRGRREAVDVVAATVEHVDRFSDVPSDLAALPTDHRGLVEQGGLVVYVVPTAAGPILVAIHADAAGAIARVRVDRADREWLHDRGGVDLLSNASARVAIVGCGSLGAGVASLLARAGVGALTLVDPDVLSWDNVGRHVLGGQDVGQLKAVAAAGRLGAHLPTTPRLEAEPRSWQQLAARRPDALRADLVVSTIAAWPDELALAEWTSRRGVPLVMGWIEPRAAAGHALSLRGRCLGCLFTPAGHFLREVAAWPDGSPARLVDGCHQQHIPYGYMELVPTQSMVARLALDVLEGMAPEATHRCLVPSRERLAEMGARPRAGWELAEDGVRAVERSSDWAVTPVCWRCGGRG